MLISSFDINILYLSSSLEVFSGVFLSIHYHTSLSTSLQMDQLLFIIISNRAELFVILLSPLVIFPILSQVLGTLHRTPFKPDAIKLLRLLYTDVLILSFHHVTPFHTMSLHM